MKTQGIGFLLLPLVLVISACGSDSNNRNQAAPQNQAPTISEVASQQVDEDGTLGPLAFTVSDSETAAEALLVEVSVSDSALLPEDGVIVQGEGENRTLFMQPAPDAFGQAEVTLTVTDADGGVSETAFTLEVTELPREEFSSWVRSVAVSPDLLDNAVGEKPDSGELSPTQDVARLKFTDLSEEDDSAYDDLLPMEEELFED